ncbi:hypothetical protein GH733_019695 [Mirounga leonina]|nr:hypothetical protein GH733_019695 [Mirounga leonina]
MGARLTETEISEEKLKIDPEDTRQSFPTASCFQGAEQMTQAQQDVLSKLDQREPTWTVEEDIPCRTRSGTWKLDDYLPEHLQNEIMENSLERWRKQKTFENNVHQSTARFVLRQNHDMCDLHGETMKPNLTLLHQSRSYEIKNPADLTGGLDRVGLGLFPRPQSQFRLFELLFLLSR